MPITTPPIGPIPSVTIGGDAPAPAAPTWQMPTPPPAGSTSQTNAQYLVDTYLAWMAAGAPMASDGKTPVGPDGKPSAGIPTTTEFDAARNFIAQTAPAKGTTISAPATSKYIVHSDGTIDPNPNYAPTPSALAGKTQPQIDQEAADAHAAAVANLNKLTNPQATPQTPEERALTVAQADLDNANAAKAAATTPGEVALANAQVAVANQTILTAQGNLKLAQDKAPGEIALTGAQTNAADATAAETAARTALTNLQAEQLKANDPLVRAQLQAQIAELQSRIDAQQHPAPTAVAPDTTAPFIYQNVYDPATKTWSLKQTPNTNQAVTTTDALRSLAQQIGLNLGDGPGQISLQDAKDLFTLANDTMTAVSQRTSALNQGATAGASILNQRSTAAQAVNAEGMHAIESSKNYGIAGAPDISGLPAASQAWATSLGGGQSVMDTAAALVHAAQPNLAGTPAGAGIAATVAQVLAKGQELGVPAPPPPMPTTVQGQGTTFLGGPGGQPGLPAMPTTTAPTVGLAAPTLGGGAPQVNLHFYAPGQGGINPAISGTYA